MLPTKAEMQSKMGVERHLSTIRFSQTFFRFSKANASPCGKPTIFFGQRYLSKSLADHPSSERQNTSPQFLPHHAETPKPAHPAWFCSPNEYATCLKYRATKTEQFAPGEQPGSSIRYPSRNDKWHQRHRVGKSSRCA